MFAFERPLGDLNERRVNSQNALLLSFAALHVLSCPGWVRSLPNHASYTLEADLRKYYYLLHVLRMGFSKATISKLCTSFVPISFYRKGAVE